MNLGHVPQVLPYFVFSSCISVGNFWNFGKKWATQIQKWKQWKKKYTQIANWTDAKLAPNKFFRTQHPYLIYLGPNFRISGQISIFRAKCRYFGPNVLISGKNTLNSDLGLNLRNLKWFWRPFSGSEQPFLRDSVQITGPKQQFWHSKINRNLTIFKFWGLKGGPKNLRFLKFRPRSEFKVFFDEIRTFGPK